MKKHLLFLIATIFVMNISAQTPPSYIPTSGLVGWWPFNGNANDESGMGNNGTLVGNTTLANDRFGNPNSAYAFDGSGDYIDCGNAPSVNITGSITISAWFYAIDYNDQRGILTKSALPPLDDSYQLTVGSQAPTDITFLNTNFGYTAPTVTWVHVVTVFDSSTQIVSLYTNGLLDTTIGVAFDTIGTSPDNLCLGAHRPTFTADWSWSGTLDDIAIWNRPLDSTEIIGMYYGPTAGVNTLESEKEISIYPNPVSDFVYIRANQNISSQNYLITDSFGRHVLCGQVTTENTRIDLSSLAPGMYFLECNNQIIKVIRN